MKTGLLTRDIASKISVLILSGEIDAGAHLSTQRLANKFGVSRSPVREAMKILAEQGILEQKPNRGFFARKKALATRTKVFNDAVQSEGDAYLYRKLAEDWLKDKIPGEATEQQLRERYKITKTQLQDVLEASNAMRQHLRGALMSKSPENWPQIESGNTADLYES